MLLLVHAFALFGCTGSADSAADTATDSSASAPPDGLLAPGTWGNDIMRFDIAADGSATLAGGCEHSTLAAATVSGGAFDWTLAYTEDLAYVDTGDHSYPVEFSGTIAGDTLDGLLTFSETTVRVTLTRGVETEVGTCD